MKSTLSIVASLTAAVGASASSGVTAAQLRRRLSFEKIAGYAPGSQVTDHCAIDRDHAAIEEQLALGTEESFQKADRIYKEGGNSKSYALITVTPALTKDITKGTVILGKGIGGQEIALKAYDNYPTGTNLMKAQYATTDIQSSYVGCQVGALVTNINKDGCLEDLGDITIGSDEYAYAYDSDSENKNGRTIAGFSTGAGDKMRTGGCKGCPYKDFQYFYDYYKTDDYAHEFVTAAFNGESTNFDNGNADFSNMGMDGRREIIKKGTAYMNVFMYVIREFEDALDDCSRGCINCNDDPVHAWDEGVCFYTGSMEGQDGKTDDGMLLHQLADKRCENYKTCGVDGVDEDGKATVNYQLFDQFALGNFQLQSGNCPAARQTVKRIAELMYIPFIQGTLRYAYKVDKLQGGEKEKAEGAVFAAAVLPRIHAASPDAAKMIYENMKVGAQTTDFKSIRNAFEFTYPSLGIKCSDIGGLYDSASKDYYPGAEPCVDLSVSSANASAQSAETNKNLALGLGLGLGIPLALALMYVMFMRKREKEGKPVFQPDKSTEASFN